MNGNFTNGNWTYEICPQANTQLEKCRLKHEIEPGVVTYACNPSTQEVEAGGSWVW
jgi:hypothetical protein